MRVGKVYNNQVLAGTLTETEVGDFVFHYADDYFFNTQMPAISVTLPKSRQNHRSNILFPFFFNMISEGANRRVQSRFLKIDENDYFGLLLKTASNETIGAITVKEDLPITNEQ
jgi:HipA-like protein